MKTVGRYEILRELGRGGMALVYLARQNDLDRFVALKELGAFHASDASFAQRFIRESRVAGSLSHPNIVTVHDYFEHEGTPYIAMEYVERGSLRPYVGKMTLAQIGGVLEGLLAGLTNAEQNGIVHRDLKPENLMVAADGRVKIADFGIAKATGALQTASFRTETGTTIGTPSYMAPEVDPALSDWIDRLLEKDPALRTQSAAAAWDELEDVVIDALGPRWRDHSRFVPATPPALGTVPLERPVTTERTAATRVVREGAWPPPATPYEEGEPTVMPAAPTQPLPQRRRTPLMVLAVLTLLAI